MLRFLSYTAITGLGRGLGALADALGQRRSALAPCRFETVRLDTMVAEVEGLDAGPMRTDLAAFECRNNRLAQLALEQDGFADTVRAARKRFGPARIGVFLGVAEGVKSAPAVMALAEQYGVEMPITREVYQVLQGRTNPRQAFRGLLRVTPGAESQPG